MPIMHNTEVGVNTQHTQKKVVRLQMGLLVTASQDTTA